MSDIDAGGDVAAPGPEGRRELDVVAVRRGQFGVHDAGDTSGFGGLVVAISEPEAAHAPYGGWFDEVVEVLREVLAEQDIDPDSAVEKVVVDRDELTLHIAAEHLVATCRALRDDQDLRFELCLGVSGFHLPEHTGRELHASYHLYSITHGRQLILEATCPDAHPHLPSVVDVYPGNDWHERETFDLFGIVFDGHPALARMFMPDDWVGHPQRKDYPLGGIPVEYKGATVPPPDTRRSYS
ncbi:MAG: NADH-quinone oxidoreductase subunit C [Actinomycetales bacterium]